MAGYKKLTNLEETNMFDYAFVISESKVRKITKEQMLTEIGIASNTHIVFRGSDTTANIQAIAEPSPGDKWYSTDEKVYYLRGESAWINVGAGEDYEAVIALVESVNERVEKKANSVIEEAEGTNIFVYDSDNQALRGLSIYGKSTQVKTTGAQLAYLNINVANYPYMGVTSTPTDDDNILISGTATDSLWNRLASVELEKGETYTLSATPKLLLTVWDATTDSAFCNKETNDESVTFIAPNTGLYSIVLANTGLETFNNELANIMMVEGNKAKPWEPYSGRLASPCPEWPQYIVNVASLGAIMISLLGKNLVNKIIVGENSTQYSNCLLAELDDFKPDTEYTISFVAETGHKMYVNENLFAYKYIIGDGTRQHITVKTKPVLSKDKESQYTSGCWIILKNSEGNTVQPAFKDVQIEEGPVCTAYEEHRPLQSFTVTAPNGLAGIPVSTGGNYTDEEGQQWVCDEIDLERGVFVQRIATKVLNENSNMAFNGYSHDTLGVYIFGSYISDINQKDYKSPVYFDKLSFQKWGNQTIGNANKIYTTPGYIQIYLEDQTITTTEMLQEWLFENPLTVQYILAEPIETNISVDELVEYQAMNTNNPSTIILNNRDAHMKLKYAVDLKEYINGKIRAITGA